MSLLDPSTLTGIGLAVGCSALVFAESGILLGFFLPGDAVLFAAGLATASPSAGLPTWVLAICVGVSAVAGDALGFALGRRYGRRGLQKRIENRLGADRYARAEAFFTRYGALALVVARYIPWVRTVVPLMAGASRMSYRWFAAGNISGALTWGVALVVLGRLSATVPGLGTAAVVVAVTVVGLSFALPVALAVNRRRKERRKV